MTDIYVAVRYEAIIGCFSTLDKAMAAVEATIAKAIRIGEYGDEVRQGPLPSLTWRDNGGGNHECGFIRTAGAGTSAHWRAVDPEIYAIELDPAELP